MGQQQRYLSTDPNAGIPLRPNSAGHLSGRVLSTDPNAGEPLRPHSAAHVLSTDLTSKESAYVSTDPNWGTGPRVLSTDPNAGEPLRAQTPTWSDQLGLNEPTDSMLVGFLRGSGGAALDMIQGASAEVQNRINKGGDPMLRAVLAPGAVSPEQAQDVMAAPDTFAGKVGSVIPHAALMAAPAGGAAKAIKNAIPSTDRASRGFQSVMAAAKDVPVDMAKPGDVALRIYQLAERGGSMPKAVRDLVKRATDPEKGAMLYPEARDFASNISRLSINEFGRLTPVVAREVASLRVALNESIANAAKQAGKLPEYKAAMREYAQAMRLRDAVAAVGERVKQGAPYATAAGAGYWLTREIRSMLSGAKE